MAPGKTSRSDEELVALARGGNRDAYAELWSRHHRAAHAIARSFTSFDPDDVVAEAFTRILAAVRAGGGPTMGFRAYLLTATKNVAREWGARQAGADPIDLDALTAPDDVEDAAIAALEAGSTVSAFRTLPSRWQEALWYSEVENLKPRQFAPLLGLGANAASALAVRARQGFRDAWIAQQLKDADSPGCRETVALLGARTRGALSARDERKVATHLETCEGCALAWSEAQYVSSGLAVALLPLVVGLPAAVAYGSSSTRPNARRNARTATTAVAAAVLAVAVAGGAAAAINGAINGAPPAAQLADVAVTSPAPAERAAPGPAAPGASAPPTADAGGTQPRPPTPTPSPPPSPTPAPSRTATPTPRPTVTPAPTPTPSPTPTPTPSPTPTPTPSSGVAAPTMTVDTSAGPMLYPAISGTDARPGATVQILDEHGRVRSTARADGTGAWHTDDLSGGACATTADAYLPAGSHRLSARQIVDDETSPESAPVAIEVGAPPSILAPGDGTASRRGFWLEISGAPSLLMQRIKLPDPAPCRIPDMTLDGRGRFSKEFALWDDAVGAEVTIGARYADGRGRHGPAVFVTVRAVP